MRTVLVGIMLTVIPVLGYAEMYGQIGPYSTLGDIKTSYPQANIKRILPAGAKKSNPLYQLTGTGISGTIVITFHDDSAQVRDLLEKNGSGEPDKYVLDALKKSIERSDDEALTVIGVQWLPESPVPLHRFISKYGEPTMSDYTEEGMTPYRWWDKGLFVYLTDDEKNVSRIDYSFTKRDYDVAYVLKWGMAPKNKAPEQSVPSNEGK